MTPADSGGVEAGGIEFKRYNIQGIQVVWTNFGAVSYPKKTLAFLQSVVARKEASSRLFSQSG